MKKCISVSHSADIKPGELLAVIPENRLAISHGKMILVFEISFKDQFNDVGEISGISVADGSVIEFEIFKSYRPKLTAICTSDT